MDTFTVHVTFDVGDPESVARLRYEDVAASNAVEAGINAMLRLNSRDGFTMSDLIEITATRTVPGVARNLLARHR